MKDTLKAGDRTRLAFKVPAEKTVPHLYPESPDFTAMPSVFATGFMVGLMEWACLEVLKPHLDAGEGSLGIHIDVSHSAATVPGQVPDGLPCAVPCTTWTRSTSRQGTATRPRPGRRPRCAATRYAPTAAR